MQEPVEVVVLGQVVQSINYAAPSANASSGITITVGSGGAAISAAYPVDPGYGGDTIVNSPVGIITAKGGGYGGFSPGYEIGGKNGGSQGGARSNSPMPLTFPGPSFGHPLGNTYDYPSDGVAADYGGNNYANWATPSFDGSGQLGASGGGGANGVGKAGGLPSGNVPTQPTWVPHPGFSGQGYAHPTNTTTRAMGGAGGDGLRLHTYRAQNILPPSHPYYPLMSQMNGYYGGGGGGSTPIHFLMLMHNELLEEKEVVLLDLIKTIPYHVLEWTELVVVEEEVESLWWICWRKRNMCCQI